MDTLVPIRLLQGILLPLNHALTTVHQLPPSRNPDYDNCRCRQHNAINPKNQAWPEKPGVYEILQLPWLLRKAQAICPTPPMLLWSYYQPGTRHNTPVWTPFQHEWIIFTDHSEWNQRYSKISADLEIHVSGWIDAVPSQAQGQDTASYPLSCIKWNDSLWPRPNSANYQNPQSVAQGHNFC